MVAKLAFTAFAVVLTAGAAPAIAQDYGSTYLDWGVSHANNLGVVGSAERSAEKAAKGGGTAETRAIPPKVRQACGNKYRYRKQYGAEDPRVKRFFQQCAQIGL